MKFIFFASAVLVSRLAFGQELPDNLSLAVKESRNLLPSLELNPELSYYSKNYYRIFRQGAYTFEAFDYGASNMLNLNSRGYDSSTPHIFNVMPMAGVNVDATMAQPSQAGCPIKN